MKPKNLKLIAKTEEDLRVVSAHLQDSIVSVGDIANLKKNNIFLIQLNRFMWEDVEKGVFRKNKRIRTVLKFENVLVLLGAQGLNKTKLLWTLSLITFFFSAALDNLTTAIVMSALLKKLIKDKNDFEHG